MWYALYRKTSFVPIAAEYVAGVDIICDQNCGSVPMVSVVAAVATAAGDESSGELTFSGGGDGAVVVGGGDGETDGGGCGCGAIGGVGSGRGGDGGGGGDGDADGGGGSGIGEGGEGGGSGGAGAGGGSGGAGGGCGVRLPSVEKRRVVETAGSASGVSTALTHS